jgi:hypothetical protein
LILNGMEKMENTKRRIFNSINWFINK